ncbi:MAG: HDOD domain-containing protein, partial [Gammaproteobacteria bacterium]
MPAHAGPRCRIIAPIFFPLGAKPQLHTEIPVSARWTHHFLDPPGRQRGRPALPIEAVAPEQGRDKGQHQCRNPYAMKQMQQQESLQPIHGQLNAIWRNSNNVATICYVVSRKVHGQRADEALLAGLLHQIGRLYILTHAHKNDPTLL